MKRTTFATILFILLLLGLGFARTGVGLHYTWILFVGITAGFFSILTKNKIPILIGLAVCFFSTGLAPRCGLFSEISDI